MPAGTRAFRRGLRNHSLFLRLAEEAKDPAARAAVAKRIEDLAATPIDTRYENRYDAALSAYLTVLADTAEPETVAKAASAAARAVNTWWTAGISRELIARAVATGWAETPAVWHVVPTRLVAGVDWHKALRVNLQKIWSAEIPVTMKTVVGNQILKALREAEVKAQAQVAAANKVIVMPQSSEEGERVVWKARGRSRHKAGPVWRIPRRRTAG